MSLLFYFVPSPSFDISANITNLHAYLSRLSWRAKISNNSWDKIILTEVKDKPTKICLIFFISKFNLKIVHYITDIWFVTLILNFIWYSNIDVIWLDPFYSYLNIITYINQEYSMLFVITCLLIPNNPILPNKKKM